MNMTVCCACCRVCDTSEMNRPRPTVVSMNRNSPSTTTHDLAVERHPEPEPPDERDDRHLDDADQHVGRDLADQVLAAADRRDEHLLERAALALAHDRLGHDRGHRQHEDGRDQPRDHRVDRSQTRVVHHAHARVETRAGDDESLLGEALGVERGDRSGTHSPLPTDRDPAVGPVHDDADRQRLAAPRPAIRCPRG